MTIRDIPPACTTVTFGCAARSRTCPVGGSVGSPCEPAARGEALAEGAGTAASRTTAHLPPAGSKRRKGEGGVVLSNRIIAC
ncbi:Hypothetical protein NTJ_01285 [Nesidiocoris tenuis]|uniref:Uncharacterized protein n=1 Tax=Nesidiocoris tenuis TaxID=355587 RepID=A0ABN7A864_9HEMI|nr:Hypothetical protein NTJ_01285 [Nesidiocoris tenuis]